MPQASDDLQNVAFPARKSVAQENLGKPIENHIADEKVFKIFEESAEGRCEKLERIREDGDGFYAWGVRRSHRAGLMRPRDRTGTSNPPPRRRRDVAGVGDNGAIIFARESPLEATVRRELERREG